MILADSSVWIDYFNGVSTWQTDLLDDYLSDVPIVIGDLILTEVLQGSDQTRNLKQPGNFSACFRFAGWADMM